MSLVASLLESIVPNAGATLTDNNFVQSALSNNIFDILITFEVVKSKVPTDMVLVDAWELDLLTVPNTAYDVEFDNPDTVIN
jgi:hypothetical protein